MSALKLPDGPYYRCGPGHHPNCKVGLTYWPPHKLRSIKGRWRCYPCFADGFGRDVLSEWDTALKLSDYLAALPSIRGKECLDV